MRAVSARFIQALPLISGIVGWLTGPNLTAWGADTTWMQKAKFGLFMHYQYRILLGYSIATKPSFPDGSQMTASEWNRLVDGFDVKGFAEQAGEARVGWVIFCLDDHYFAWPCAPNQAFDRFTRYAPGEKCSRRDLIRDLADALNAKGVRLICYFAGLNGYMKEPKVSAGLSDATPRGTYNDNSPPSAESRRRRLAVLKEYADRYQDKIAGWWFDGMGPEIYKAQPGDWSTIRSIVRSPNPEAVIAFSYGANEQACLCHGVDDFTGGDTWSKQELKRLTPERLPAVPGVLWHGKIYCGNIYHGQGNTNQFTDQELIEWINSCNRQGGVCTLDWPFDPKTGHLKDFGFEQLKRVSRAVKGGYAILPRWPAQPLVLKDVRPTKNTTVILLEPNRTVKWEARGADLVIARPAALTEDPLGDYAFVLKITTVGNPSIKGVFDDFSTGEKTTWKISALPP